MKHIFGARCVQKLIRLEAFVTNMWIVYDQLYITSFANDSILTSYELIT